MKDALKKIISDIEYFCQRIEHLSERLRKSATVRILMKIVVIALVPILIASTF